MKTSLLLPLLLLAVIGPLTAQQSTTIIARSEWVSLKKEAATAPVIIWVTPQVKQTIEQKQTCTIKVKVQSAVAVSRLQFIRNGKEMNGETRGFKRVGTVEFSEVIPLVAGSNEIHVKAINAIGSTTSESRIIIYQPGPSVPTPDVLNVLVQKRLALIVANGSYSIPLKNPANDGRAIKQQLEALDFVVTYKENLSRQDLEKVLDSFYKDLGSKNVGLFYYAGHGLMVNGENYVQPVDANPKTEVDVPYKCYPLSQIVGNMAHANAKGANLVFWDACRNNPYRSWHRGPGELTYAPVRPSVGTMIIYATEPGKQAYDGDEENGLFTSELVKHISRPNLGIYELIDRVGQGLEDRGFKQPPYPEGFLKGGFMFKAN